MNAQIHFLATVFQRVAQCLNAFSGFILLWVRFSIGQVFFFSGLLKVANWDSALILAAEEYPVPWMSAVSAAYTGAIIEVLGGALFILGLASRMAATAMLLLVMVSHIYYISIDLNLIWMWFLLWVIVSGPGGFSFDAFFARATRRSHSYLIRGFMALFQFLSTRVHGVLQLVFRLLLAAAAYNVVPGNNPLLEQFIPTLPIAGLSESVMMPIALCLFAGMATRWLSLVIAIIMYWSMVDDISVLSWLWSASFVLLATLGAGTVSVDYLLGRLAKTFFELGFPETEQEQQALPHIVIIGAGFGGIACARRFKQANVRVTLIDKRNHHLFQPLLYQVATTVLAPSDIAVPIREIFRLQKNVTVLMDEITGIDRDSKQVLLGDKKISFDYLVLSTGAKHNYFGHDEWVDFAPGLKRVEDATEIRRRVLMAFERADGAQSEEERAALMTFIVIGAGPTGVEMAGAIAELAHFGMEHDFRNINPVDARVILVDSGDRVLATFNSELSVKAEEALIDLGVEVFHKTRATDINELGVQLGDDFVESKSVVWAAGVVASPAAKWLGEKGDRAGRLIVDEYLNVPDDTSIFAIGDTALAMAWEGNPVPGLAPAAKQMGEYSAKRILADLNLISAPGPFAYKHLGSLATIGRKSAIADFGFIRLTGSLAWWLWGAVHVMFLVGFRSRFSVMLDWAWGYFTYRTSTRLITEVNTDTD